MSETVPLMETGDAMRKPVMRKVAWRLSPFLELLYFIPYLDRTNLAFAAPHGMNEALGFSKAAFGLASGLFFVGYLILEVPSNLALHKFGARRWIARIMVSWGIVASAMADATMPQLTMMRAIHRRAPNLCSARLLGTSRIR